MLTRKFVLAVLISLGMFGLCAFGQVTGAEVVQVLTLLIPAFSAANAFEHYTRGKGDSGATKNPTGA